MLPRRLFALGVACRDGLRSYCLFLGASYYFFPRIILRMCTAQAGLFLMTATAVPLVYLRQACRCKPCHRTEVVAPWDTT